MIQQSRIIDTQPLVNLAQAVPWEPPGPMGGRKGNHAAAHIAAQECHWDPFSHMCGYYLVYEALKRLKVAKDPFVVNPAHWPLGNRINDFFKLILADVKRVVAAVHPYTTLLAAHSYIEEHHLFTIRCTQSILSPLA